MHQNIIALMDQFTNQGFQWPNIEIQAALKTTQISGNFLNFVKISGYLRAVQLSIFRFDSIIN